MSVSETSIHPQKSSWNREYTRIDANQICNPLRRRTFTEKYPCRFMQDSPAKLATDPFALIRVHSRFQTLHEILTAVFRFIVATARNLSAGMSAVALAKVEALAKGECRRSKL